MKGVAVKLGRITIFGFLFVSLFVLGTFSTAHAQESDETAKITRRHCFSTNPILDMFTWWNAEYAFRLNNKSTIGLAGSYISVDDGNEKYQSGNLFYRYYPQGDALTGFFFGARLGYNYIKAVDDDTDLRESGNAYSFGIDIGYDWLLGEGRNFYISLGIGAVRLFGGDLDDVAATLPTVRLVNIGVAF